MASLVVNRGLQRIGAQASQATAGAGITYSVSRQIQTMSWDLGATAFAAANTKLNDSADVGATVNTHYFDRAFDSAPSSGTDQKITHLSTIETTNGNFLIKRIALHDDTAANVTNSSTTLVSGVDGQSLTKTSDFTLATTLIHLHTSV